MVNIEPNNVINCTLDKLNCTSSKAFLKSISGISATSKVGRLSLFTSIK